MSLNLVPMIMKHFGYHIRTQVMTPMVNVERPLFIVLMSRQTVIQYFGTRSITIWSISLCCRRSTILVPMRAEASG